MKSIIVFFILLIIFIFYNHYVFSIDQSKYFVLGRILEMEQKAGFPTDTSVINSIDGIIKLAKNNLDNKKFITKDGAIYALKEISRAIKSLNIIPITKVKTNLLSRTFKTKEMSCINYCLLYLEIGKTLGLPIYAVNAPKHMFISWEKDSIQFNWETLYDTILDNNNYIKNHSISKEALEKGKFLKKLTVDEINSYYLITLAEILRNEKDYIKAMNFLDSANKFNKENEQLMDAKGLIYFNMDSHIKAIDCFNKSILADSNDFSSYNNLGGVYLKQNNFNNALDKFRKAIALTSKFPTALWNMGQTFNKIEKYDSSIYYISKAIELDSTEPNYFIDRGYSYTKLHKFSKAIKDCQKAISLDSNNSTAYYNLGFNLQSIEEYEKSIEPLKKALKLDSNNLNAMQILSFAYFTLEKFDFAIHILNKIIKLVPTNFDSYKYRASCFDGLKEYANAASDYEYYINNKSETAEVDDFINITGNLVLSKNFTKGELFCQKALTFYHDDLILQMNLAHCYLFTGRADEAIKLYINIKNKKYEDEKMKDIILYDFQTFKELGFDNVLISDVKKKLK
ncbi:MAG: Tetratricopeptide 2 repeat protein [Ignavibacteria bacterium]|nr:Tetratricopeptide 2 repeat protein [Ignavibacteria bacterium]